MTEEGEEWRDVAGYEGRYQMSNLGRVKSLARQVEHVCSRTRNYVKCYPELILQQVPNDGGYLTVNLHNKRGDTRLVHHLVLSAFVGPRPGSHLDLDGCHNDGNKENNRSNNLRWDTRTNNEADKIEHGTSNRGDRNGRRKLSSAQVEAIRVALASGARQREIADFYGVSQPSISAIKSGVNWREAA